MKIYLDSARIDSWKLPTGCPAVQGVTTNPTLVFQAGLPVTLDTYQGLVHAVADAGLAELMLQLPRPDLAAAGQWLDALRKAAQARGVVLTIKLPCAADWEHCIRFVQSEGQAVLLTGLSNAVQLLWARDMGAQYVAPYLGRLATDGRDIWALVRACVAVQNDANQPGPRLLAASIKSHEVMAHLLAVGAAAVTLPPSSLAAWSTDPVTQTALDQFERDIHASLQL
ncbi:hypothetical protein KIK84_04015 [Curvibacter sp. CHRR-16]|uniref:transaldolase family protein n=1 Tax=Curvibacter sp. CHRR-16 TaxID=2835872 RepID=UPI001BD93099|nr:transaldolase family protein [Curvibacter sp. CHRR-16]MBT0569478.1 hypothetical protein [Curvibacter sp. CHRR-16]